MIFRLKTSKQTEEIFKELESRTHLKPYTLVKHAIAWSVKENTSVKYGIIASNTSGNIFVVALLSK